MGTMRSSIIGKCNDARSEDLDLILWFIFDSHYDFGEHFSSFDTFSLN